MQLPTGSLITCKLTQIGIFFIKQEGGQHFFGESGQ